MTAKAFLRNGNNPLKLSVSTKILTTGGIRDIIIKTYFLTGPYAKPEEIIIKRIVKNIFVMLLVAALLVPAFFLTSCKVDYRDDSEIYSCYYYAVDGVDLSADVVYYTLELRTDGKLITRYKTKANSDSGKDDYSIEGSNLVVSAYFDSKTFDIAANEIIISEYIDNKTHLFAKFRLTQSTKTRTDTIFTCIARTNGQSDLLDSLRYFLVSFDETGEFNLWYRDKTERKIFSGTYTFENSVYHAVQTTSQDEEQPKEWFFTLEGGELSLHEDIEGVTIVSSFAKTYPLDAA